MFLLPPMLLTAIYSAVVLLLGPAGSRFPTSCVQCVLLTWALAAATWQA